MQNEVIESVTDSEVTEAPICPDCDNRIEEGDEVWKERVVHTPRLHWAGVRTRRMTWYEKTYSCDHDGFICANTLGDYCEGNNSVTADTPESFLERMMSQISIDANYNWTRRTESVAYCLDCGETPAEYLECQVDDCYGDHLTPRIADTSEVMPSRLAEAILGGASEHSHTLRVLAHIEYALGGFGGGVSYETFEREFDSSTISDRSLNYLKQWMHSADAVLAEKVNLEVRHYRAWHLDTNTFLCPDHEDYVRCESCDQWADESEMSSVETDWSSYTWCDSCIDNGAIWCDDCDRHEDVDYECESRLSSKLIQGYGYKPTPEFIKLNSSGRRVIASVGYSRDRTLYMGFELEVESRGDYNVGDLAEAVHEEWEDSVYFKHDGSLSNGVEIVSHPHTLAAFKSLDWSVLQTLSNMGARSWNTSTCGFHVHLSRSAFKGVRHLWLFGQFFAQNGDDIVRIAGRNGDYGRLDDNFKREVGPMAKGRSGERYHAINFQNSDTIEVRVFKGSLKVERVHAYLELCDAVHAYSATITANGVLSKAKSWKEAASKGALSWGEFAEFVESNIKTYPVLATYLYDNHTPSTTN